MTTVIAQEMFLRGVVFASGVALVCGLLWLAWDTRQLALKGNAAHAYIERSLSAAPPKADPAK